MTFDTVAEKRLTPSPAAQKRPCADAQDLCVSYVIFNRHLTNTADRMDSAIFMIYHP